MAEKLMIGGQAVIEGVMMLSKKKYAIAVRTPSNKIETKIVHRKPKTNRFSELPVIRGVFRFVDVLFIGINAISYSANASLEEEQELTKKELIFTIILSLCLNIALFVILPLFITNRFFPNSAKTVFNLIDGLMRIFVFLVFLISLSFMKDIRRIFEYHGAEHMTVNCYENKEKLIVKNVKKHSRIHPRCGTTFLLIVMTTSILIFSIIPTTSIFTRFISRILLIPLIAGISYEFLRFSSKNIKNPIVKIMIQPGLLLQNLTTRKPNDSQIEVAIVALKKTLS